MSLRNVQVSDSLDDIARVGVILFRAVTISGTSPRLQQRIELLAQELRAAIGDRPISSLESVQRARSLFHRIGVDPTRERPSSEALLRKVLKGDPLPSTNLLADALTFVSLSHQCPLSAHDWDAIAPPVLVRIGRPEDARASSRGTQSGGGGQDEAGGQSGGVGPDDSGRAPGSGERPRHERKVRHEGQLVLVDGEGVFGGPGRSSPRAQVGPRTVRALVVAWAPSDAARSHLESVLEETMELAKEFCGARVEEWGILG